jgi:signal transduction histidine kinase
MRQHIYILLLLSLSATSGFGAYAAESLSPKRIEVVFGYENIGRWEQQFTEAVSQIFLNDSRVVFSAVYLPLDTQEPTSFTLFSTFELTRFSEVDAVIAVRPQASTFVNQWRDTLFPSIPRLYVAPSSEVMTAVLASETDAFLPSVVETATRETLELLPRLLPDLEHIYILSGDSATDTAYLTRIQSVIQELGLQQTIHYLVGLTPSEVSTELNIAPLNTAAVFTPYSKDRTGQLFRTDDVVDIVSEQVDKPLFGIFDGSRNSSIVGGSITSATRTGKEAAEVMLALLFDDTPQPPTVLEITGSYFFDAIQLDRFGIDRDLLPEGSEVINDSPGLLQQYWWQFTLGGAVFLIQLFFIAALGRSLRRRNEAERIAHAVNEQLRRSQKMEAVGQLTGGIAHDFNNILAIIMGSLELVQLGVSGDKKLLSDVDRALEGATRGASLINKLLGFSRVQINETSPTSLNQLIENMDDLLVKSLTVSIKIETQLDAKLRLVNVDVGDLEGAILNLALNARDAMPSGGKLTIETANKLLDADFVKSQPEARIGEYAMLSVRDAVGTRYWDWYDA